MLTSTKNVNFSFGLNYSEWEIELQEDPDRDFLLDGIREGFHIINPGSVFKPAEMPNYRSATVINRQKVEAQLRTEIDEGHYIITPKKPAIVSALGAIPKPNSSDIRLIHDCSLNQKGKQLMIMHRMIHFNISLLMTQSN